MDSNQGAKDSSQDSKCTELDGHTCQLSPTADWGHTNIGSLSSVQPESNSTPTVGNISQLIRFLNGTNKNDSPPSDTTMGNDLSFPSVINDVSSVPRNVNHHPSSKSSPSNSLDTAGTNLAATNQMDNDVSTIDNRSQLSTQSLVHSCHVYERQPVPYLPTLPRV